MTLSAPPARHIGHYELHEKLGSGGTGVVFRATDVRLGRRVAVKFLGRDRMREPAMRQRFIREARIAASLDHPNICTMFEVGETDDGEVFIVMPLYEGETLDRVIARGRVDAATALSTAVQIAGGLAAAHDELLVHCDIKPANVMVVRGIAKILDFGLARFLSERTVAAIEGTPAYMSPEQLRGEPLDQRTDIWSLGVVLYEMLAGNRPFRGRTIDELQRAVTQDNLTPVTTLRDDLPPRIDRVMARALASDPRLRYERIEPMLADLQDAQADVDTASATLRRALSKSRSSIAVLPFEDMSSDKSQMYLCDGIAEEILRALSAVPDLYVASRTSAFQFKNRAADIREIGTKLNVDHVVEGSIRRSGDRVRISAQLVSVADGYRLWYERFDRDIGDIFAVEDEIAERIASALQVGLTQRRTGRQPSVTASEAHAYELYLQGREFFHQHRRKAYEIAQQLFSQAIAIDPHDARAYAGIADCNSFLRLYYGGSEVALKAADEASAKALALDPDLAEAHAARGLALFVDGKLEDAGRELRKAIELDPQLYEPHYIAGRVAFSQGRIADAAAHFRDACAIAPGAWDSWYVLGMCCRRLGDTDRACNADLACVEAVKQRIRAHPDDTRALTMGAAVLAKVGEPERAADWLARAVQLDSDDSIVLYNAACVYAALGNVDDAFQCLEGSAARGGLARAWLTNDPDLDPLRSDPRFDALVARFGA